MDGPAPFAVGTPPREVVLTRKIFAWDRGSNQPALMKMPGSQFFYLALFSSEDALRAFHERASVPFTSIKLVEDGPEFLSSFEGTDVAVILDPCFTDAGRVRFVQVQS